MLLKIKFEGDKDSLKISYKETWSKWSDDIKLVSLKTI